MDSTLCRPCELRYLLYFPQMLFRLDRTAHHAGTHEQTAQYYATQQPATMAERLLAAAYLNSVAYGYDRNNSPRLDRTAFFTRRQVHRDEDK